MWARIVKPPELKPSQGSVPHLSADVLNCNAGGRADALDLALTSQGDPWPALRPLPYR